MPSGIYPRTEWHRKKSPFQKGHTIRNTGRTRFKKGNVSWSKLHPELMPRGKDNGNWKGGKYKDRKGYVYILKPKHPFCNHIGYVHRSRFFVEKALKHYLKPKEQVHHINEIKDDDRIENLMAFVNNSAHKRFHHNPNNVKPEEIIFDGRQWK